MKTYLLSALAAIVVIVIIVTGLTFVQSTANTFMNPPVPTPTPFARYNASFAIVTNGITRDFTSPMYHNLSENVFITKETPQIITVTAPGVTWQSFFDSLPMTVSPTCLTTGTGEQFCNTELTTLRFFLNGTENPQLLQRTIQPKDRVLISYGVTTESEVRDQYKFVPGL